MLKYQEFINERESNLKTLAWFKKSYEHALRFRIPITPKLGKLLNDSIRITTFHITSIDNILNIRSLISKKKSLSTFTEMSDFFLEDMDGIQTEGTILFQFEGDLLINAGYDIMSRPDEQGRRWLTVGELKNTDFFDYKWKDFQDEIDKKFSVDWQQHLYHSAENYDYDATWIKSNAKEISNYLNYYIKRAEEFVLTNKKIFLEMFSVKSGEWNEILVNNISVKDVLLYNKTKDTYFADKITKEFGTLEKLKEILESFVKGQIYITQNPKDAIEFVKERKQS